jgi:hypothetical protein
VHEIDDMHEPLGFAALVNNGIENKALRMGWGIVEAEGLKKYDWSSYRICISNWLCICIWPWNFISDLGL